MSSDQETEDTTEQDTPQEHSGYYKNWKQHIADTRSHLVGVLTPNDPLFSTEDDLEESSQSSWTTTEQNAFFHALSVHSRLRPDLIAHEVGAKTTSDVCRYIDMLDAGVEEVLSMEAELDGGDTDHDEPEEAWKSWRITRRAFPSAREVSDEWLDLEELQARVIQELSHTGHSISLKRESENQAGGDKKRHRRMEKCQVLDQLSAKDLARLSKLASAVSIDDEAPVLASSPARAEETALEDLTPKERRKLKDRLYRRKQRAAKRGEAFDEVEEWKQIKELRRGPTVRSILVSSPQVPFYGDGEEADEPQDVEGIDDLTPNDILEDGLHMFHLSRFSKLVRAFTPPALSRRSKTIPRRISYALLIILRAYLEAYLTDLIGRLITYVEQEERRTAHTKVFRAKKDIIRSYHVKHTASLMGREVDLSSFWEDIGRRLGDDPAADNEDEEADDSEEDGDADAVEDEDEEADEDDDMVDSSPLRAKSKARTEINSEADSATGSVYQHTLPPSAWLPSALIEPDSEDEDDADIVPNPMAPTADPPPTEEIDDDEEEAEFAAVLEAEDYLHSLDAQEDEAEQQNLWISVGAAMRKRAQLAGLRMGENQTNTQGGNQFKSKEMIEDTDEE
ncbi:hypothetical protein SISNIDRAFT_483773 [Sistotremastrum niveocremeum HHB9708]|uniref:Uncharacterized protein n=1 Tax=Sistotremastrum niveocremeum HHB9708 TaxID=1314777 RepID=A0A164X101_9AGAM|nr:hypothetical protein SISNIDRAFT_483773 [Sistotremastrum niveocremeum HHB9708]